MRKLWARPFVATCTELPAHLPRQRAIEAALERDFDEKDTLAYVPFICQWFISPLVQCKWGVNHPV